MQLGKNALVNMDDARRWRPANNISTHPTPQQQHHQSSERLKPAGNKGMSKKCDRRVIPRAPHRDFFLVDAPNPTGSFHLSNREESQHLGRKGFTTRQSAGSCAGGEGPGQSGMSMTFYPIPAVVNPCITNFQGASGQRRGGQDADSSSPASVEVSLPFKKQMRLRVVEPVELCVESMSSLAVRLLFWFWYALLVVCVVVEMFPQAQWGIVNFCGPSYKVDLRYPDKWDSPCVKMSPSLSAGAGSMDVVWSGSELGLLDDMYKRFVRIIVSVPRPSYSNQTRYRFVAVVNLLETNNPGEHTRLTVTLKCNPKLQRCDMVRLLDETVALGIGNGSIQLRFLELPLELALALTGGAEGTAPLPSIGIAYQKRAYTIATLIWRYVFFVISFLHLMRFVFHYKYTNSLYEQNCIMALQVALLWYLNPLFALNVSARNISDVLVFIEFRLPTYFIAATLTYMFSVMMASMKWTQHVDSSDDDSNDTEGDMLNARTTRRKCSRVRLVLNKLLFHTHNVYCPPLWTRVAALIYMLIVVVMDVIDAALEPKKWIAGTINDTSYRGIFWTTISLLLLGACVCIGLLFYLHRSLGQKPYLESRPQQLACRVFLLVFLFVMGYYMFHCTIFLAYWNKSYPAVYSKQPFIQLPPLMLACSFVNIMTFVYMTESRHEGVPIHPSDKRWKFMVWPDSWYQWLAHHGGSHYIFTTEQEEARFYRLQIEFRKRRWMAQLKRKRKNMSNTNDSAVMQTWEEMSSSELNTEEEEEVTSYSDSFTLIAPQWNERVSNHLNCSKAGERRTDNVSSGTVSLLLSRRQNSYLFNSLHRDATEHCDMAGRRPAEGDGTGPCLPLRQRAEVAPDLPIPLDRLFSSVNTSFGANHWQRRNQNHNIPSTRKLRNMDNFSTYFLPSHDMPRKHETASNLLMTQTWHSDLPKTPQRHCPCKSIAQTRNAEHVTLRPEPPRGCLQANSSACIRDNVAIQPSCTSHAASWPSYRAVDTNHANAQANPSRATAKAVPDPSCGDTVFLQASLETTSSHVEQKNCPVSVSGSACIPMAAVAPLLPSNDVPPHVKINVGIDAPAVEDVPDKDVTPSLSMTQGPTNSGNHFDGKGSSGLSYTLLNVFNRTRNRLGGLLDLLHRGILEKPVRYFDQLESFMLDTAYRSFQTVSYLPFFNLETAIDCYNMALEAYNLEENAELKNIGAPINVPTESICMLISRCLKLFCCTSIDTSSAEDEETQEKVDCEEEEQQREEQSLFAGKPPLVERQDAMSSYPKNGDPGSSRGCDADVPKLARPSLYSEVGQGELKEVNAEGAAMVGCPPVLLVLHEPFAESGIVLPNPRVVGMLPMDVKKYGYELCMVEEVKEVQVIMVRMDTTVTAHLGKAPRIIIAFRGTANLRNAKYDMKIHRVVWREMEEPLPTATNFHYGNLSVVSTMSSRAYYGCLSCLRSILRKTSWRPTCHAGFLSIWKAMKPRVIPKLLEILKRDGDTVYRIFTTGHSLGGALASLCAYSVTRALMEVDYPIPDVTVYTFGQPCMGNRTFRKAYEKMVPRSFRIHNESDMVVGMVLFGACHLGIEVVIDRNGNYIVNPTAIERLFPPTRGKGFAVANHLVRNYGVSLNAIAERMGCPARCAKAYIVVDDANLPEESMNNMRPIKHNS